MNLWAYRDSLISFFTFHLTDSNVGVYSSLFLRCEIGDKVELCLRILKLEILPVGSEIGSLMPIVANEGR